MKKLMGVLAFGFAMAFVATADAAELYVPNPNSGPVLYSAPTLLGDVPPAPVADGSHGTVVHSAPIQLFNCVKYKDLDEMAPCAKPRIIQVPDPCPSQCCDPCACCQPRCVYIQICVPPCGCEEVKTNKSGDRIKYDFGEYSVDVRIKKGYIEVDYQD